MVRTKAHGKTTESKSQKSLESRIRQIWEPNTLTEDQSDGHWREVIATFVKGRTGIASRAEVQEFKKPHPEVFTVDDVYEVDTQSETELGSQQY